VCLCVSLLSQRLDAHAGGDDARERRHITHKHQFQSLHQVNWLTNIVIFFIFNLSRLEAALVIFYFYFLIPMSIETFDCFRQTGMSQRRKINNKIVLFI